MTHRSSHGRLARARAPVQRAVGSAFLVGGLVAYGASAAIDVTGLVPFAAGNFLYIGASDLVPEVNRHRSAAANLLHFTAFAVGVLLLWAIAAAFGGEA